MGGIRRSEFRILYDCKKLVKPYLRFEWPRTRIQMLPNGVARKKKAAAQEEWKSDNHRNYVLRVPYKTKKRVWVWNIRLREHRRWTSFVLTKALLKFY